MSEVENQEKPGATPPLSPGCEGDNVDGSGCARVAAVMYGVVPVCDVHYALAVVNAKRDYWNDALEVAEGWSRDARERQHEGLIRLSENMVAEIDGFTGDLTDVDLNIRELLGRPL